MIARKIIEVINECTVEQDCEHLDKTCYENKCICKRARPIEDKERSVCLPHASFGEQCLLNEQCIGNSICVDGYCTCRTDHISVFNPSTKLYYCHEKRRLHEECNYDTQCPENAFCSTKKYGCLCQNGFGQSLVRGSDGIELARCLPKICRLTSECESEYHICDDNKCICLATHFDPHTAECYKFGAQGGQLGNAPLIEGNTTTLNEGDEGLGFNSIINDLMGNGDKLWPTVIILTILTLIILIILTIVLRKYYRGHCWTHTKEYKPNNDQSPNNNQFNKNSINNKSFRKRSGDLEGDDVVSGADDDTAADRLNLVTAPGKKNGALANQAPSMKRSGKDGKNENHYVEVDMREETDDTDGKHQLTFGRSDPPANGHHQPFHHELMSRPLPSSTSTPV